MWDHPSPVFIDFETQSACELSDTGGRLYAAHDSTRILMLSACWHCPRLDAPRYLLWIPDHIKVDTGHWQAEQLWPFELKPKPAYHVERFRGKEPPHHFFDLIRSNPVVAHNAFGFDKFIWERFFPQHIPADWLDSMYLARASGRPGSLDALSKHTLGIGKDRASKLMPELCMNVKRSNTSHFEGNGTGGYWAYPLIKPGDLQAFSRYAIADVEILHRLWSGFDSIKVEVGIIKAHNDINARGVAVDTKLLSAVEDLSNFSVSRATDEIAEICGPINIRSTQQMHEWLSGYGITINDDNGKPCLRKEVVQRYLDSPYIIEENLTAAKEIPPVVLDVLRLRMKALRITGAKVSRAKQRLIGGRLYDLHTYHQAHTGRASSQGVQIHNMPRPIKGVDIQKIIEIINAWDASDIEKLYDRVKATIPNDDKGKPLFTVDDINSTLIRPLLIAKPNHVFGIVDYSQVEARCLAWLADEWKLIEGFRRGVDIYREFAAKLYGCTVDAIDGYQRQVAKVVILGAGYGMGPDKLRVYSASQGVDLSAAGITADQIILHYRDEYTNIAGWRPDKEKSYRRDGLWHKIDTAVREAVGSHITTSAARCIFQMNGKDLVCTLPSGREIYYPDARIADMVPGYCYTLGLPLVPKATVVYQSPRGIKSLYGGIETENVDQAICRDAIYEAADTMNADGLNPVMVVHDEIVCEFPEFDSIKSLTRMIDVMSYVPDWAEGFPLACEGFTAPRFLKKPWKGYYEGATGKPVHKVA